MQKKMQAGCTYSPVVLTRSEPPAVSTKLVSCSENAARAEDVQTTSGITGAKAQLIPYSPLWDHESSECRGDLVEKERYTSRQHRLPAHHGQVKK